MQGTTGNISVAGMLRLLCHYGRTGVLKVKHNEIKGFISLFNGRITGSETEGKNLSVRESVINLLLVTEEGSFYFEETVPEHKEGKKLFVEDLILESARRVFEMNKKVDDYVLPGTEVVKIAKAGKGREIVLRLSAKEWNFLISFDGDTNIDTVIREKGYDTYWAKVMLYGFVSAGMLRRTRFKLPEITRIAAEELGNIGAAIVDSSFSKNKIDKRNMGMRDFITILNDLEYSFAQIVGKTKAKRVTEKIWEETK